MHSYSTLKQDLIHFKLLIFHISKDLFFDFED